MFKSCKGCNKKISLRENFIIWAKTNYKKGYICKDCKTKYRPTKLSIRVSFFVLWIANMLIMISDIYSKAGFIPYMICFTVATFTLPLIITKYEVVENNA